MTCKDCIHYDLCEKQFGIGMYLGDEAEEMDCFEDKSKYVNCEELKLYIQNYIREIQMNDYGNDEGIHELWQVYEYIEKLSKGCTKRLKQN